MRRALSYAFLCSMMLVPSLAQTPAEDSSSPDSARLARIVNEYWTHELATQTYHRLQAGMTIDDLPDISQRRAKANTAFDRHVLRELAAITPDQLGHEEWLTLQILRWRLRQDAEWEKHYWLIFPISPATSEIGTLERIFAEHPFRNQADLDHYLTLLKKCPGFFNETQRILQAQARRGIVYPRAGLPIAIGFISSYLQDPANSVLFVNDARLKSLPSSAVGPFQQKVAEIIQSNINPALQRLLDYIKGDYSKKAPDAVGLAQYPGGKDYYRFLVRFVTTLDISPEEVHQIGLKAVEQSEARMDQLRRSTGFAGTRQEFNEFLKTDPRFFPKSPEELEARFRFYLHRIEPLIPAYFSTVPKAPYDVKRLDPRLEPSETLGHYQSPSATNPVGIYYYNGVTRTSLLFAGHFMLHELIPGHHFQRSLQAENANLPEFRRTPGEVAFSEGWGDYSGYLGIEMGVYADAYDLYGMMAADVRKSVRLVVDTGMNYLGWSRARAIEYMRQHTVDSESQIESETLVESVDFPGQRLAYKIGSQEFIDLREKAKKQLGERFDIRQFHRCVLESGSMPLSVLAEQVDWCIKNAK